MRAWLILILGFIIIIGTMQTAKTWFPYNLSLALIGGILIGWAITDTEEK